MARLTIHLDHVGVERVELLADGHGVPLDAYRLVERVGPVLVALDAAVRAEPPGARTRPKPKPVAQQGPQPAPERGGTA